MPIYGHGAVDCSRVVTVFGLYINALAEDNVYAQNDFQNLQTIEISLYRSIFSVCILILQKQ